MESIKDDRTRTPGGRSILASRALIFLLPFSGILPLRKVSQAVGAGTARSWERARQRIDEGVDSGRRDLLDDRSPRAGREPARVDDGSWGERDASREGVRRRRRAGVQRCKWGRREGASKSNLESALVSLSPRLSKRARSRRWLWALHLPVVRKRSTGSHLPVRPSLQALQFRKLSLRKRLSLASPLKQGAV